MATDIIKGKLYLSKLKKADLVKVLNALLVNSYSESFINRITKIKGVRFVEEKTK